MITSYIIYCIYLHWYTHTCRFESFIQEHMTVLVFSLRCMEPPVFCPHESWLPGSSPRTRAWSSWFLLLFSHNFMHSSTLEILPLRLGHGQFPGGQAVPSRHCEPTASLWPFIPCVLLFNISQHWLVPPLFLSRLDQTFIWWMQLSP